MSTTWRQHCRPIIAQVIADNKDKSEKEIRAALREAYPYGERANHPYATWCDEVKKQLKAWRGVKEEQPAIGLFKTD